MADEVASAALSARVGDPETVKLAAAVLVLEAAPQAIVVGVATAASAWLALEASAMTLTIA